MADHVDITLWINRRWKDAIEKHLKDETLQLASGRMMLERAVSISFQSVSMSASVPKFTRRMPRGAQRKKQPAPTPPTMW